ncbi:MAG: hypothetical protein J7K21_06845, partial [Desulfurococcales archaeon]|nr:hypothetical protein [Desulfurococcales archaeon]
YVYTQHNLVYGIDGPYYIIQYYSIAYTGAIKYPDPPLAFYILYPFQYILDKLFNDPGLGLKIGVSVATGLTTIVIYLDIKRFIQEMISTLYY